MYVFQVERLFPKELYIMGIQTQLENWGQLQQVLKGSIYKEVFLKMFQDRYQHSNPHFWLFSKDK